MLSIKEIDWGHIEPSLNARECYSFHTLGHGSQTGTDDVGMFGYSKYLDFSQTTTSLPSQVPPTGQLRHEYSFSSEESKMNTETCVHQAVTSHCRAKTQHMGCKMMTRTATIIHFLEQIPGQDRSAYTIPSSSPPGTAACIPEF